MENNFYFVCRLKDDSTKIMSTAYMIKKIEDPYKMFESKNIDRIHISPYKSRKLAVELSGSIQFNKGNSIYRDDIKLSILNGKDTAGFPSHIIKLGYDSLCKYFLLNLSRWAKSYMETYGMEDLIKLIKLLLTNDHEQVKILMKDRQDYFSQLPDM